MAAVAAKAIATAVTVLLPVRRRCEDRFEFTVDLPTEHGCRLCLCRLYGYPWPAGGDTRRAVSYSTPGRFVTLAGSLLSWSSRPQVTATFLRRSVGRAFDC